MTIEQSLLYKLVSRVGELDLSHGVVGYAWCIDHEDEWALSSCDDTPEKALKSLADQFVTNHDVWYHHRWKQALTAHVEEQRALQPLVQREVIVENCSNGVGTNNLLAELVRCFSIIDIHKFESTKVTDDLGNTLDTLVFQYAIGDVVGEAGTRLHALQSLLDKVYADPVLSAKWTAYLERAE